MYRIVTLRGVENVKEHGNCYILGFTLIAKYSTILGYHVIKVRHLVYVGLLK